MTMLAVELAMALLASLVVVWIGVLLWISNG